MRWMPRGWTLVGFLLAILTARGWAQVTTTVVEDTIYRADGSPASGTVLVNWGAFTSATGAAVSAGSVSATLSSSGLLHVNLTPNAGAMPVGTYYTVVYHLNDGRTNREYWVVPVSSTPVKIAAIRSTVLPTSVAMQTVSKQYVDTQIAAAVAGAPLDASPYVLKAGDTMTGALELPGDPATANQATNKHYVDVQVAGLSTGLAQKVALTAFATQTVAQPAGTTLETSSLNGTLYAQEKLTPPGNNGIANTLASSDCASGCDIRVERGYAGNDLVDPALMRSRTHISDIRNGQVSEYAFNPHSGYLGQPDAGLLVSAVETETAASMRATYGQTFPSAAAVNIVHNGLAGGNNNYPEDLGTSFPYFKSTYSALHLEGTYNTVGQHVLQTESQKCYAVGDCLLGGKLLVSSGGNVDNADEGAHAYDFTITEDSVVFRGTCTTGCTTGSTQITVTPTVGAQTQGEGRFLINTAAGKTISAGILTGGSSVSPQPIATFTGTSFPVSTFLRISDVVAPQATTMSPGTVTVAIATSGVPGGFSTNTASLPASSGVACVADAIPANYYGAIYFETVNYSVSDGTHLTATFKKPHKAGATFAVGGLCGYGLEQVVDTANGIRQVFPVIGSTSATGLYYASNLTPVLGISGQTSAYLNTSNAITSLSRSSNVVTVTLSGSMGRDLNGLAVTIAGAADASFNGIFPVTTTSTNTFTYSQTGANATSSGGTASYVTGNFVLYPAVEVQGVLNAATNRVDGTLKLAPNTIAWSPGDTVEQPHYHQQQEHMQQNVIAQVMPRPLVRSAAGISYQGNMGPGMQGWLISNDVSASNYFGNGGTHVPPDYAIQTTGIWNGSFDTQAGERSVFSIHCNSHGCGKWNSGYDLFELDRSSGGYDSIQFAPQTSTLSLNLRGTQYGFSPTGMSAGALSATGVTIGTPTSGFNETGLVNLDAGSNSGMGGKLLLRSSSNGYGQVQLLNPSGKEVSMTFISNGTNFGQGPWSTGGGSSMWMQGAGMNNLLGSQFGIANLNTGNAVFALDANGGMAVGSYAATLNTTLPPANGAIISGNVGIGTNAPGSNKLCVNNGCTFAVDGSGNVTAANLRSMLTGVTSSIGGSALTAGTCSTGTVAVTGASVGAPVVVSASDGTLPNPQVVLSAAVTGANTVSVQVCAVAAVTPAAKTYNVRVIQ